MKSFTYEYKCRLCKNDKFIILNNVDDNKIYNVSCMSDLYYIMSDVNIMSFRTGICNICFDDVVEFEVVLWFFLKWYYNFNNYFYVFFERSSKNNMVVVFFIIFFSIDIIIEDYFYNFKIEFNFDCALAKR